MTIKSNLTDEGLNVFILTIKAEVSKIIADIANSLTQGRGLTPDHGIKKTVGALPKVKRKLISRGLLPAAMELNFHLAQLDDHKRSEIVSQFNANPRSPFQIVRPQSKSVDAKFVCNIYLPAPVGAEPNAVRMLFNRAIEASPCLFLIDLLEPKQNKPVLTPYDAAVQIFN